MINIYLTGDTHGNIDIRKIFQAKRYPEQKLPTENDYLIILGDFGCIFFGNDEEAKLLDKINSMPWTTLFIDGNHENFHLLNNYPTEKFLGSEAGKIRSKIFHLKRGEIYTIQDKKFFTLGGAESIDKNQRRFGVSWWPEESISYGDIAKSIDNLGRCNFFVDYVLTHDAPASFVKDMLAAFHQQYYETKNQTSSRALESIYRYSDLHFKKWFFGHYHLDYSNPVLKYQCLYDGIIKLP